MEVESASGASCMKLNKSLEVYVIQNDKLLKGFP